MASSAASASSSSLRVRERERPTNSSLQSSSFFSQNDSSQFPLSENSRPSKVKTKRNEFDVCSICFIVVIGMGIFVAIGVILVNRRSGNDAEAPATKTDGDTLVTEGPALVVSTLVQFSAREPIEAKLLVDKLRVLLLSSESELYASDPDAVSTSVTIILRFIETDVIIRLNALKVWLKSETSGLEGFKLMLAHVFRTDNTIEEYCSFDYVDVYCDKIRLESCTTGEYGANCELCLANVRSPHHCLLASTA